MISKNAIAIAQKNKLNPYLEKAEQLIDERLMSYIGGRKVHVSVAQLFEGLTSDLYPLAISLIKYRYEATGAWKVTLNPSQRDGDTLTFE
jgi:hypothetical protein